MPEPYRNTYTFTSQAAPRDAFHVVRFNGAEGLSRPYSFDILLLSENKDLEPEDLIQSPAVFTMKLSGGDLPFHGIPSLFEMRDAYQDYVFYRAVLVPKLWWLTLTVHNQIFLDQDVQGFLTQALADGGLREGQDFEFRLSKAYKPREYVCQFRESHFDFVSRWMEREGLTYFFEQDGGGEKMVITDVRTAHSPMPGTQALRYMPPSGLDWPLGEQSVKRFSRVRSRVPKSVTVADRNYRTPAATLRATSQVSAMGKGDMILYGEHVLTGEEAGGLAQVRAEELACRENMFEGLSSVPHVRSGYLFELSNHFRDGLNAAYLTVEARHEGGQEAYLSQLLGVSFEGAPDMPYYRNTFTAIPASVQFRPERRADKPAFYGVMNAVIDASQSGEYAEVDDQGRYKVILPFDLSGRSDGKASSWLRMIQPYGGADMGMHFPLHKGCEVLLAFQDGDPDRPVIQAAVPNPEHKSLLTSDNATKCMLTTGGGNLVHIEDQQGSERILMQSPTGGSYVRCGQPNDPPSAAASSATDMYGWKLNTSNTMLVRAGLYNVMILGTWEKEYIGNYTKVIVGESFTLEGTKKLCAFLKKFQINLVTLYMRGKVQRALGEDVALDETCVEMAGELVKLRASATELDQMRQDLEAKRDTLTQSFQHLSQTKLDLQGDKQVLNQQRTALTQEVANLDGQRTNLNQSKQALVQAITVLDGQKNTLAQQRTLLTENNNQVGEQLTRLQGIRTEVSDMHSTITASQTIL